MTVYFWAGLTISLLTVWGALNSRKGRYLRRHDSSLVKINLGIILLCAWAGLNFAGNLSYINNWADSSAVIILDSTATALLLGACLLMAIAWMIAAPDLKNRIFQHGGVNRLTMLGEKISSLSIENGRLDFLYKAAELLAGNLLPEYYSISMPGEGHSSDAGSFKMVHDQGPRAGHRFMKVNRNEIDFLKYENSGHAFKEIEISAVTDRTEYKLNYYLSHAGRIRFNHKSIGYINKILSSRLQSSVDLEDARARIDSLTLQNDLYSLGGKTSDLASYLKDAFYFMSEKFGIDYISIAVIDSTIQNMYRYTYAEVGGSLIEKGICYPLKQTAALKVALEKSMMIANTLESDFYRDDYHLYRSGFSSRLVYPLCDDSNRIRGVLTLAAVRPRAFNDITEGDLEFVNLPLCRMMELHNVTSMMNALKKQVVSSFNLTFGIENGAGLTDFYDRSARILAETLPATMCRIWSLNHKEGKLESIGFYSLHENADSAAAYPDSVGLELMPRHKAAIAMGKAIIVNQSNPEYSMDNSEIKAMGLPGVKSAILAPMRLQNRISGIISVGEVRNWERRSMGQQELLYSQIISTITALVREIDRKSREVDHLKTSYDSLERKSRIYETYPNLPSRVSSSVSSLLGAAQLIRQRLPEDAEELIRYNEIILKGADNLIREFRKFEEVKNSLG